MGMSTKAYWAEIDAERAAKRDKDIQAAREAIGLDALKADAMLTNSGGIPVENCFEGPEDRAEHEARVRLMEGGAK